MLADLALSSPMLWAWCLLYTPGALRCLDSTLVRSIVSSCGRFLELLHQVLRRLLEALRASGAKVLAGPLPVNL